jgi:hypothetical protein
MAELTISSNLTPPITLSLDTSAPPSPLVGWLLDLVQPTVVGTLPVVGAVVVAPYGVAGDLIGTLVALAAAALMVLGVLRLLGH